LKLRISFITEVLLGLNTRRVNKNLSITTVN